MWSSGRSTGVFTSRLRSSEDPLLHGCVQVYAPCCWLTTLARSWRQCHYSSPVTSMLLFCYAWEKHVLNFFSYNVVHRCSPPLNCCSLINITAFTSGNDGHNWIAPILDWRRDFSTSSPFVCPWSAAMLMASNGGRKQTGMPWNYGEISVVVPSVT